MAASAAGVVKVGIPRELYIALLRIQVSNDLDWEGACRRAAILLDENSRKFMKLVRSEAERLYSSRFMQQPNKARKSIAEEAYNKGYRDGYERGRLDYAIWYYCAVCGEKIYVRPNSNSHMAIIRYMKEDRWGHTTCHKKRNNDSKLSRYVFPVVVGDLLAHPSSFFA